MSNTKDKIIKAALKLISENKIAKITTRKIAEKAGVNVAAINYHFTSKENLIMKAIMHGNESGLLKIIELFENGDLAAKQRLDQFITDYEDLVTNNPEASRLVVTINMMKQIDENEKFMKWEIYERYHKSFLSTLSELADSKSEKEIQFLYLFLISAYTFPMMCRDYYKEYFDFDYFDKKDNEQYFSFIKNIIYEAMK